MTESTPLLRMRGITKHYPGVVALDDVDLEVRRGEVHVLLGENGAGKSTLMKILAGAVRRDAGEIELEDEPLELSNPRDAQRAGVSIIYQEFNLIPHLTVAENILLGREPGGRMPGWIDQRRLRRDARRRLEELRVSIDPDVPVARLGVAEQQMVEVAKALVGDARVLVMDEPTSALTEREIERLFDVIRSLTARGVAVIYISHRMEELLAIGTRVTVLRDGRYIGTREVGATSLPELVRMMVGRDVKDKFPQRTGTRGDEILRVEGLTRHGVLHDVSFSLRRGEVLGLGGLMGAGRTELARAIFGVDPLDAGRILLRGRPARVTSPVDAIRQRVGFLTEDRKRQGLVLGLDVRANICLANLNRLSRFGIMNRRREAACADRFIADLRIKTPSPRELTVNLSGGNQQKVVLAKWLCTEADILLFDEPTRGIDVGAKMEIYELINRLSADGKAILMISSELPEIIGMSDRILVMHQGRIAGEFSGEAADPESILHCALGSPSR